MPEVPLLSIGGAVSYETYKTMTLKLPNRIKKTYYVTCAPTRAAEADRMVATVKALMVTLILSLTFRWEDVMIDVGISAWEW